MTKEKCETKLGNDILFNNNLIRDFIEDTHIAFIFDYNYKFGLEYFNEKRCKLDDDCV